MGMRALHILYSFAGLNTWRSEKIFEESHTCFCTPFFDNNDQLNRKGDRVLPTLQTGGRTMSHAGNTTEYDETTAHRNERFNYFTRPSCY